MGYPRESEKTTALNRGSPRRFPGRDGRKKNPVILCRKKKLKTTCPARNNRSIQNNISYRSDAKMLYQDIFFSRMRMTVHRFSGDRIFKRVRVSDRAPMDNMGVIKQRNTNEVADAQSQQQVLSQE